MGSDTFISDVTGTLVALAPFCALAAFILAGLHLRGEGGVNFQSNGGFTKWLLWAAIFASLPWVVTTITSPAGHALTVSGSAGTIGTKVVAAVQAGATWITGSLLPVIAGMLVLKSLLDSAEGKSPLPSIVSSLFVAALASAGATNLAASSNTDPSTYLTALLSYVTGTLCPVIAGIVIAFTVIQYATGKRWGHMLLTGMGFAGIAAISTMVKAYTN